jgi:hypothetical protein
MHHIEEPCREDGGGSFILMLPITHGQPSTDFRTTLWIVTAV